MHMCKKIASNFLGFRDAKVSVLFKALNGVLIQRIPKGEIQRRWYQNINSLGNILPCNSLLSRLPNESHY